MGMYPRGDFRTGWRFLVHVFYTKVAPLGLLDGESQGPRRIPVANRRKPVDTRSRVPKHRVFIKTSCFPTRSQPVETRRNP